MISLFLEPFESDSLLFDNGYFSLDVSGFGPCPSSIEGISGRVSYPISQGWS